MKERIAVRRCQHTASIVGSTCIIIISIGASVSLAGGALAHGGLK